MKSRRTRLETAAINRQERLPLLLWLRHSGATRRATVLAAVLLSLFLPPLASAQSPVTLRLMDWADIDEMPLDRQAVALFECQHPDIRIIYEPNPGRQYEE